ncbi:choice-of-anchor P family protein [Actinokineospora inagensis]|uniref:choice-of-anchor P family protein n=1 Tax=Actinokineospora inagensis TaxID=103730 RepID=UPI000407BD1F|nr:choice-of-anchor P family protein [Actinokineospora inagensis]
MRSVARRMIPAALALVSAAAVGLAQPAAAAVPYHFEAHASGLTATTPLGSTNLVPADVSSSTPASSGQTLSPPAVPLVGTVGTVSVSAAGTEDAAGLRTSTANVSVSNVSLLTIPLLGTVVTADSIGSTATTTTDAVGNRSSSGSATFTNLRVLGNLIPNPVPDQTISIGVLGTVRLNHVVNAGSSVSVTPVSINLTIPVVGAISANVAGTNTALT